MALLEVENLKTEFRTDQGQVYAVRDVSFTLEQGEALGIVGESGSGKSQTMYSIIGLLADNGKVTANRIAFDGKDINPGSFKSKKDYEALMKDIRGNSMAMIFQDPMTFLNPILKIGKQLTEPLLNHTNMSKEEARKRAIELMTLVGIPSPEKRIDQYPFEFSGGMRQRIIIAIALANSPKLVIADEPTTALDVTIQAQILELMKELQKEFNMAILFITHDLGVVARMCDRVAVMYLGKVVETGDSKTIYANPQHPYTRGLMGSVHKIGGRKDERLFSIEGTVPLAMNLPKQCGFYDRCDARIEGLCDKAEPELVEIEPGHKIACFACNNPACQKHRQEAEAKIKEDEAKGPAEEGGKKRGKR